MKTKIRELFCGLLCTAVILLIVSCTKSTEPEDTTGNPDNGNPNVPAKIIDIKVNGDLAVYLTNTGYVYNASVQNLSTGAAIVKYQVKGLKDIVKIAAGTRVINGYGILDFAALDKDGKIYVWDIYGGDGKPDSAVVFTKMSSFTSKIVDISLGGYDVSVAMALDNSGRVWVWGNNSYYQLGDGTYQSRENPAIIAGLPQNIKAISAGPRQCIALATDGSVYHWGAISWTVGVNAKVPELVADAGPASSIDAGDNYNLSLKTNGSVYAWGHLLAGNVPGISNASIINAGSELYFNPMMIKQDGTLWKTWFSMSDGSSQPIERVTELSAYTFSLMDVSRYAYYVTTDGKLLVQRSYGTAPLIMNTPTQ